MAGSLLFPEFRAFDDTGAPLSGGLVYTYEAGTSTPKDTYTTSALSVANTNPVVLDSEGYPTSGGIWLSGTYKIIIKDADGVQQGDTIDNYSNEPATAGPAGTFNIVTAGGTADAITANYSPDVTLSNLTTVAFVASAANATTTPTFAPDGLTAHTITKRGGVALVPGDIPAALAVCIVEYNSANTRWELLNPASTAMPWVVAAGTADALTATYAPAIPAVYDGLVLSFRAANANATTTPTFAPSGLTARTITKKGGTALVAGDIAGNLAEYWLRYNSANTRWELLNPTGISGITDLSTVTIDTAADYIPFYDASGAVYGKALANSLRLSVQRVSTETGAVATGTTTIPSDDTIPQNTEGDQYMTLAVTPKNTANILIIDVVINLASSAAGGDLAAALFQDTTANALAVAAVYNANSSHGQVITFRHIMTAGTTSATTFKVRAGNSNAGTTTFNGSAGARLYGGIYASSIMITEYTS